MGERKIQPARIGRLSSANLDSSLYHRYVHMVGVFQRAMAHLRPYCCAVKLSLLSCYQCVSSNPFRDQCLPRCKRRALTLCIVDGYRKTPTMLAREAYLQPCITVS